MTYIIEVLRQEHCNMEINQNEWIQELHWLTSVMIPSMLQSFQIG